MKVASPTYSDSKRITVRLMAALCAALVAAALSAAPTSAYAATDGAGDANEPTELVNGSTDPQDNQGDGGEEGDGQGGQGGQGGNDTNTNDANVLSTDPTDDEGTVEPAEETPAPVTETVEEVTYTITLDATDGILAGAEATQKLAKDKTIVLPAPTRDGYQFVGWATSPNAQPDQIAYYAGDTYTVSKDETLYAVWAKRATVKKTTATRGANMQAMDDIDLTQPQYDFGDNKSYWTFENGTLTITVLQAGAEVNVVAGNVPWLSRLMPDQFYHVEIKRNINTYTLKVFDMTGWFSGMSSQSVVVRAASANGAMVAQDVADTADEWYIYSTDASINPGKDETVLYPEATYMAAFAENSYTIAYDANYSGASKISTTTPASWDATGLLGTVATPTRKTYTFEGWYTAPTGGKLVTKNSKYNREDLEGATATLDGSAVDLDTDGATVTLYAHWNVKDADLDKLVSDSGTIEKDTTGSADGSDVPKDKYWVPADVQNELDAALANAQKVADDPNATGEERIAAYERLQAAYNAYNAAKKPGTKVEESSDDNGGGDNGGGESGSGSAAAKGSTSSKPAAKSGAPTTGDRLADAMILVGSVALISAGFILLAMRMRRRGNERR